MLIPLTNDDTQVLVTPVIHGEQVLGKTARWTQSLATVELGKAMREVTYTSDEVTAVCPVTGQPDWYEVAIVVSRSRLGLESKSLKLYLQSFRNDGIFCEHLADLVSDHVLQATHAGEVKVTVLQKPRGGVSIQAVAKRIGDSDV